MMSGLDAMLRERGIRWDPLPSAGPVHPEVSIEGPADVAAEISLDQRFQLGAFTHLNGGFIKDVSIGRYCSFARDVQIGHGFHPTDWLSVSPLQYATDYRGWTSFVGSYLGRQQAFKARPFIWSRHTQIGNDVWLGNHVVVRDGVTIGDGAVVGAHSVVTRDVPSYAVVAGSPARIIRMRFRDAVIERLLDLRWWRFTLADLGNVPFDHIDAALDAVADRIATGVRPYSAPKLGALDLQPWL